MHWEYGLSHCFIFVLGCWDFLVPICANSCQLESHTRVTWAVWQRDIYCVSSLNSQIQAAESLWLNRSLSGVELAMGVAAYHPKLAPAPKMALKIFQLIWRQEWFYHPQSSSPSLTNGWIIYFNRESPWHDQTFTSITFRLLSTFVPPYLPEDWGNCKANLYLTLKRDEAGETKVLARKNLYGTYRRVGGQWSTNLTDDRWWRGSHLSKSFPEEGTISVAMYIVVAISKLTTKINLSKGWLVPIPM